LPAKSIDFKGQKSDSINCNDRWRESATGVLDDAESTADAGGALANFASNVEAVDISFNQVVAFSTAVIISLSAERAINTSANKCLPLLE
jgi:hypothetical protein